MELGYLFYPASNPHALGHPRLDVNLYELPTGEHFDPQELTITVDDPIQGWQQLTFYHPADPGLYRVCIGRIVILDHVKKEVEAFSFGGELETSRFENHSLCCLTSPAPIFDMGRFAQDELELVSEYEAELARLRARWLQQEIDFEERLAAIAPERLFWALTGAVQNRLRSLPASAHSDQYWASRHTLHAAICFLEPSGELPPGAPTIDDLIK